VIAARALLAAAALLTALPALAGKPPLAEGERVDLNRASAAELMKLPGVGQKRAAAIVARRARTPFRRVEDVLTVKGLSRRWLAKEREHLAVGPAPSPAGLAGAVPARAAAGPPGAR